MKASVKLRSERSQGGQVVQSQQGCVYHTELECQFLSRWYDSTWKKSTAQEGIEPKPDPLEEDAFTTGPRRRPRCLGAITQACWAGRLARRAVDITTGQQLGSSEVLTGFVYQASCIRASSTATRFLLHCPTCVSCCKNQNGR